MKRIVSKRALVALPFCAFLAIASVAGPAFAQEEPVTGHPATVHGNNGETPENATAGEEHAEHEHALKPVNWFDFDNKEQIPYSVYLLNFGVLCFLYWYFGKGPLSQGLKDRRASIAKEIEEAQKMKKEAKQRAKKYQAKLEGLDQELEGAKTALIEAGKADKDRIVRDAQEKAARMERDAKALLEQERRQLHEDLVMETIEAAVKEAEDLLKQRVLPEDHERLAEDFLASLGKNAGPSLTPSAPEGGAS